MGGATWHIRICAAPFVRVYIVPINHIQSVLEKPEYRQIYECLLSMAKTKYKDFRDKIKPYALGIELNRRNSLSGNESVIEKTWMLDQFTKLESRMHKKFEKYDSKLKYVECCLGTGNVERKRLLENKQHLLE